MGKLPEGVHGIIREHFLVTDDRAWIPQLKPRTPTAKLMNAMLAEREACVNRTWDEYGPESDNPDPNWYPTIQAYAEDYNSAYRWCRWKWLKEVDYDTQPNFLGLLSAPKHENRFRPNVDVSRNL